MKKSLFVRLAFLSFAAVLFFASNAFTLAQSSSVSVESENSFEK